MSSIYRGFVLGLGMDVYETLPMPFDVMHHMAEDAKLREEPCPPPQGDAAEILRMKTLRLGDFEEGGIEKEVHSESAQKCDQKDFEEGGIEKVHSESAEPCDQKDFEEGGIEKVHSESAEPCDQKDFEEGGIEKVHSESAEPCDQKDFEEGGIEKVHSESAEPCDKQVKPAGQGVAVGETSETHHSNVLKGEAPVSLSPVKSKAAGPPAFAAEAWVGDIRHAYMILRMFSCLFHASDYALAPLY